MRIACFGELLLRMTAPGRELLVQSGKFDVFVGGAEANVAVGLACLGHKSQMVSAIPDNPLGRGAVAALRAQGVDCSTVHVREGRMGLYFLSPGAGLRAAEIIYDRAETAFASAPLDAFDWPKVLEGVDLLHLSGITPALGPIAAAATIHAAETARDMGIAISFDANYRARLWQTWDSDPRSVLTRLVSLSDTLFGNHRDISLLVDRTLPGDGSNRRRQAAEAAFAAFPDLKMIASTARHLDDADRHRIAARVDTPMQAFQTEEVKVAGIIDRIGSGDAFAAGILHGMLSGQDLEGIARSGLALSCLKHSLPGDASLFRQADIDAFLVGEIDVRR